MQIATAIIGILGGGVGGGLHLVNNLKVGHAATLVGIGAGPQGGSLAIYNAITYPPTNKPVSRLLTRVAVDQKGRPIKTVQQDPTALATATLKLSDDLAKMR